MNRSHTLAVLSLLPVASSCPLGLKATLLTQLVWPCGEEEGGFLRSSTGQRGPTVWAACSPKGMTCVRLLSGEGRET